MTQITPCALRLPYAFPGTSHRSPAVQRSVSPSPVRRAEPRLDNDARPVEVAQPYSRVPGWVLIIFIIGIDTHVRVETRAVLTPSTVALISRLGPGRTGE